jgi:hypothetical protein
MKKFLITFLVSSAGILFSQKQEIEALKKLGRDSLIKLAIKKMDEPGFIPGNYDRVTIKTHDNSLVVTFGLSVALHNKQSCFYDRVFVALVGSGTGKSIQGDCDEPKFYSPSKSDKRKIDFVFDAINKDNEVGDIPDKKLSPGSTMEISEHLDHYFVEVSSWSTYSHYKVNKVTGKISEAGHKHYARSGDENEEEEEIK